MRVKVVAVLALGCVLGAGLVSLEREIHHVNSECKEDRGLVVHGQFGQPGVSWSGYTCIEKGQH